MKSFTIYEYNELGAAFYKTRLEKGLTQEQLAKKFHLSKSSISRFESGRLRSISFERIQSIANHLGVELKFCVMS